MQFVFTISLFFMIVYAQKDLGGVCNKGKCKNGWSCSDNHCLPMRSPTIAIGPCLENKADRCPVGFHCLERKCYPNPDSRTAIGPCLNSECPDNYYCFIGECVKFDATTL